ncbi:hypothetical protein GCM10022210_31040 [Mucilaginibacter dorajii]|uniref:Transposase n=1 Tax=Mucilaginibacter dorajii TaxID=692994 RepID=A0ABP7Q8J3_9SPHI
MVYKKAYAVKQPRHPADYENNVYRFYVIVHMLKLYITWNEAIATLQVNDAQLRDCFVPRNDILGFNSCIP